MDILMITHFTQTPGEAGNGRFNYLANLLYTENDIEMVTTSFSHRTKKQRYVSKEQYQDLNYKLTLLKEPGYKKNVSLMRFYSHWRFGRELKKYLKDRKKPDVVYCSVPSLDAASVAAKYAKTNEIPFIIDIQDLWPEAFRMVFDVPVISDIIFAPMKWKINKIYETADSIIAVSNTYLERALENNKKCEDGQAVFLGTSLKDFDKLAKVNHFVKDDIHFRIGYIGTLGHSYNIKLVIDAIKLLEEKCENPIEFWIMGDGPLKADFEEYAKKKNVKAIFTGRLQYNEMIGMLSTCDIAVNPIVTGAAQSIINKHADYVAAGLAVVNTQESQEYRDLVDYYQMGMNCSNSDVVDFAEKIFLLIQNDDLRKRMGYNARKCAEELFDREHTYKAIVNEIMRYDRR